MKITAESELIKNQKHADIMAPEVAFEVLQTPDGDALFFSIGTDHVFYVTRELRASQTGWTKIDLSTALSASHAGAAVAAKSFALSQNPQTLAFDLALVLTVTGTDFLYLSLSHFNNADAWATGVSWTVLPFDAAIVTAPSPLTIADVYLMNIPSVDGPGYPAVQNCFVDILRTPGDPLQLLDRYYIQPSSAPHWVRHTLAADLKAGSISSCLGHRTDDYLPGIYTFGNIETTQELIYAPQYNYFRPAVPPNAARLTLPAGATSVSSALNSAGDTNLFVAAAGGLYLFTPDNQGDQASPALVVPSSTISNNNPLAGASSLAASTVGSRTVVWGVAAQGDLFHVYCPTGSEATAAAWSTPIPLCSGVERFAFYINIQASNNVLFAHLSGQQLLQLTQDPVTSTWTQRNILLPPTSIDDMVEYNSFTTHIHISDDNGVGVANTPVTLTSTSSVTVYINDVYHVLTPTVPVNSTADVAGTITVIQETQSVSAVCFQITIPGPPSVVANVDPLSKAMQKLSTIQSGDDLGRVQIKTANGTQQSLVSNSVPSDAKNAAAKSIVQLLKVKDTLPTDGSTKPTPSAAATVVSHLMSAVLPTQPLQLWGASCGENGFKYHEGDAAIQHLGITGVRKSVALKTVSLDLGDSIEIAAGDLFNYLKSAWKDVESFVIQEAEGFYHFCAKIGDKIYNAILDCVSAVVGAVEFVFNQIKVFFEDLIAWLGFLFEWDDIKRTHKVMKNIIKQYAYRAISSLDSLETSINNAFIALEDNINAWAGVTDPGETIGTQQLAGSSVPGGNSPQSSWALHHTKNGLSSADTSYNAPETGSSALDKVLEDLEALVTQEGDYLKTTITQIKEQVVDHFSSLTPIQVIQKMMAIVSDLVIKSARNLIVKVVDVIKIFATGLLDLLDAPLDIPILSFIYKLVTGDELTFLDLICLIGAIPATILFKIIGGETPYPDNSHTQALIDAPDFATLSNLLSGKITVSSAHKQSLFKVQAVFNADQPPKAAPLLLKADWAPVDTATSVLNIGALFGSVAVAIFAFQKRRSSSTVPNKVLRYGAAASYLLYAAPNYPGATQSPSVWSTVMNDTVTLVSIGKTFADNTERLCNNATWTNLISPFVESILNIVWLFPPCFEIAANAHPKDSDWCSLSSNLSFDIGGTLTFFTSPAVSGPGPSLVFFGVAEALTLGYGVLCVATAGTLLDGN